MTYPPVTYSDHIVLMTVINIMRRHMTHNEVRQHVSKQSGVDISVADWEETMMEIEYIQGSMP